MADQRLFLKSGNKEIVIAVRHNTTWRNALEGKNNIADFLNSSEENSKISFCYEHKRWFCDPKLMVDE